MVGEQVPVEPALSQASHWPSQAVVQHTPSTQLPERHWVAAVQAMPLGMRATHMLSRQKLPSAHSMSASQLVRHAVDEHA